MNEKIMEKFDNKVGKAFQFGLLKGMMGELKWINDTFGNGRDLKKSIVPDLEKRRKILGDRAEKLLIQLKEDELKGGEN